jgi:DNA-binding NtrC family response regulator
VADPVDDVDQQLIAAGRAYRRADELLKKRRAERDALMFAAVRSGRKTKSHVARMVGITREHLTVLMSADEKNRAASDS